jgi:hypothetical protein
MRESCNYKDHLSTLREELKGWKLELNEEKCDWIKMSEGNREENREFKFCGVRIDNERKVA